MKKIGNDHGAKMGVLSMPSVKKLHAIRLDAHSGAVEAVLSERHSGQTGGKYTVRVAAGEVALAVWRIAVGTVVAG